MDTQPFDTITVRENIRLEGNFESKFGFYRQNSDGNLELIEVDNSTIKIVDGKLVGVGVVGTTRSISADDTITADDNNGTIEVNATSDIILTINSGFAKLKCEVFVYGAGNVTYVAGSGMTLLNPNNLFISNGVGSGNSIVIDSTGTKAIIGGDLKSA